MDGFTKFVIAVVGVGLVSVYTPFGEWAIQKYDGIVKAQIDNQSYDNQREVEAQARQMMAEWTFYEHSSRTAKDAETREQARLNANHIAAAYNEYYLKNAYVWSENIPSDIKIKLPMID